MLCLGGWRGGLCTSAKIVICGLAMLATLESIVACIVESPSDSNTERNWVSSILSGIDIIDSSMVSLRGEFCTVGGAFCKAWFVWTASLEAFVALPIIRSPSVVHSPGWLELPPVLALTPSATV